MSLPEPPTPRLTVRPPTRTLRVALDGDDHLLVTGGPGQGKSTMSLRLAADIAVAWRVPTTDDAAPLAEPVVPVRLTARTWPSGWACRRCTPSRRASWPSTLAPFQRAAAARYELQPFDEEALRRFAEHWFDEEGADTAVRFVRQVRHAHLDELVQVPLLATIAAIIFGQHDDLPLPDNEYSLYEAYLTFLRSARPAGDDVYERVRIQLLEYLGCVRLTADRSLTAAAHGWFTEQIPAQHRSATWQEELVSFLTSTGPLVLRDDELRFLHHSFAEHLAATSRAANCPISSTLPPTTSYTWCTPRVRKSAGGTPGRCCCTTPGYAPPKPTDWCNRFIRRQRTITCWRPGCSPNMLRPAAKWSTLSLPQRVPGP
jgi:cellulose synthase operon protein C